MIDERPLRRTRPQNTSPQFGIPCSPKTLAKLACVSTNGPPFRKAGRFPFYSRQGLDQWAMSKIGPEVRSTSQIRRAA